MERETMRKKKNIKMRGMDDGRLHSNATNHHQTILISDIVVLMWLVCVCVCAMLQLMVSTASATVVVLFSILLSVVGVAFFYRPAQYRKCRK